MTDRRSTGPARPEMREERNPNRIVPGYFAYSLVKGGPKVAARIWRPCMCGPGSNETFEQHVWTPQCDRFPPLVCEVNGFDRSESHDKTQIPTIEKVWMYADRISEADYRYLLDDRAWARTYAPDLPEANPTQPVDLGELPPIF